MTIEYEPFRYLETYYRSLLYIFATTAIFFSTLCLFPVDLLFFKKIFLKINSDHHFIYVLIDADSGDLLVKNASQTYSGIYICTASNRVGTDECSLELNVTPRKY